jgi:hypothetical protein
MYMWIIILLKKKTLFSWKFYCEMIFRYTQLLLLESSQIGESVIFFLESNNYENYKDGIPSYMSP